MSTILTTGATGTIGSTLIPLLRARDCDVRALVRDPRRGARLAGTGVDVAVGDFADPTSLRAALDGVDTVFLACGNVPQQVAHECALVDEAARAGVRRIVKLSARGADLGATVAYWRWHAVVERHLEASGIAAVLLRPGFLMSNILASADQVRAAGMLVAPAGSARIAMVDPADVAAVAAVAMTTDAHEGRTLELTGPESIGFAQVASHLSDVTGRHIRYVDVPAEAASSALVEAGLPPYAAEQVVTIFATVREGGQELTTDDVATLTGRPARSFADYAQEHADAFGTRQEAPVV